MDGVLGGAHRWQETRRLACDKFGMVGYLGWALDTFEQTEIFQAMGLGPDFLERLHGGFNWPVLPAGGSTQPSETIKPPLVLRDVKPSGASLGFCVQQRLSQ